MKPVCGTWALGSLEYRGRAFVRLHRHLMELHQVSPIDEILYEEPLSPGSLHGHTNVATLYLAAGLAAHVESFAEAMGIKHRPTHQATWRRHFLGSMPRGTKSADLKHMAMRRCRELGFEVIKHDAAEAAGLLDYQLSVAGILPPWRNSSILQEQMRPRSAA